jgi:hypothetical protein
VVTFPDFPVLWLGEEFHGYNLTAAQRDNYTLPGREGIRVDRLGMVYGTCEKTPGDWGCVPPVVLSIHAPGTNPCAAAVSVNLSEGAERDDLSAEIADSTTGSNTTGDSAMFCIHEGIAVQVQSSTALRKEIVQSLMLANASVKACPPLAPVKAWLH